MELFKTKIMGCKMRSFICHVRGSSNEEETWPPMSLKAKTFISLEWDTIQSVGVNVDFMLVSSPVSFETSVVFAL